MDERLDRFGQFLVRNQRDRMLYHLDMLLRGHWNAPSLKSLQKRLAALSAKNQATVRETVNEVITSGMHDLLFALQEESDANGSVRVFVDGQNVARLSDGLHGEIFGKDGWIVRFSEYPAEDQIELSRWWEKKIAELLKSKEIEDGQQGVPASNSERQPAKRWWEIWK